MDEFEEIYARCFSGVHRYARRLTRDEHLAEELTAETFFKALKNLSRYDESKADIRVWLCQIAKNTWISQCRRRGRALPLTEIPDASGFSVERALEDRDAARRLHALLHRMDEPYKEVFALRVFGELPYAEIAALFGKTENWARVTYHRAKNRLTREMEDSFDER
ncbi:MAG: RNA polymerase sigma factor [Firmicutes bacterium]|nr:RNA polymerase sigma factor [Bacillota bacterium]